MITWSPSILVRISPNNRFRSLIFQSALLLVIPFTEAVAQTDSSLHHTLDSTVVAARKRTSPISAQAVGTRVDMKAIAKLPTIMGTADPLRFIKLLPSVQTGSEVDVGIHIQGCDHGHNLVSINDAPVYGSNHLLGIFSVFNPSHFSSMDYSTNAVHGRLGGSLDMRPSQAIPDKVSADLNLNLIAAQGTVRVKTGERSALSISARRTFLNQVYSSFLKVGTAPYQDPFEYSFGDLNIALVANPSRSDKIYADAFYGSDRAYYSSESNPLGIDFGWRNGMAALHWDHYEGDVLIKQMLFASATDTDIAVQYNGEAGNIFSDTKNYGYKGSVSSGRWLGGAELLFFDVLPQYPRHTSGYMTGTAEAVRQKAIDGTAYASWTSNILFQHWTMSARLGGNWYYSPEKESFWSVSPTISLAYDMFHNGRLELRAGSSTQNIFLTGVTSLGFPVEFNVMSGRFSDPQKSIWSSLSYDLKWDQEAYAMSASIYFRRLYNQIEYSGSIFDYLGSEYDLGSLLLNADGWNYGLNLIVHKQAGKFTGWAGYSLGRSLRRSEDGEIFPSNFERIHELNIAATYTARRWDAGGTLVAASGTPFTAPESMYLTASQIICRYGKRNGARLAPYIRLDLNFNWYFRNDGKVSHGINASLYNALACDNQLSYRFVYEDDSFAYRPFGFNLKLMPGLGWFYKF